MLIEPYEWWTLKRVDVESIGNAGQDIVVSN